MKSADPKTSSPLPLKMVWINGLEPSTPCMSSRYSNQLSYTHIFWNSGIIAQPGKKCKPFFRIFSKSVLLNVYFAALMAATKGSPGMGPSFTPMDQDSSEPWTRCQKNVVSSLREMPANAVWPANIFLAIACDSVTQAVSPAPPCVRPFVKRTVFETLTGRLESLYCCT